MEKPTNSIFDVTENKKEIMKIIADNMLKTRPHGEVKYMPFIYSDVFSYTELGFESLDLKKLFGDAKSGDVAYAAFGLLVPFEDDILLTVKGRVKVIYNGSAVLTSFGGEAQVRLHVLNGINNIFIKCEATDDEFGFKFVPSTVHYPKMWAKDYLYYIREVFTLDEFRKEQGIAVSKLYRGATLDGVTDFEKGIREYVFPNVKRDKKVNLSEIFDSNGCFLALTYIKNDGSFEVKTDNNYTLYVNEVNRPCGAVSVNKGDIVEIMFGSASSFEIIGSAQYEIPFLSSRKENQILLLQTDTDKLPEIQFKSPYTFDGKNVFWRLCGGEYLRPYLDTYFYGQWFYAIMVGNYGLLKASEIIGSKYLDYFKDATNTMADFYRLMKYETEIFGAPSFLGRGMKLPDLDAIGTMGMNFAELYRIDKSKNVKYLLGVLSDAIDKNIPRFNDGTFNRGKTMWVDDTFMSCPFLVRMGNITGDRKYYDDCMTQIRGFKKRLYIDDLHLFSHIYFTEDKRANNVPWGRGNGWVMFTLSELFEHLPADYDGLGEVISLFKELSQSIRELQDENGMWHQVLTDPETYAETSCGAMFILAISRGIRAGILDESYRAVVDSAWNGICRNAIDKDGNVYGVCKGSGCSYDKAYYAALYAVKNDDHGTGVVLAALESLIKM